jgi:hypothetical protein
MQQTLGQIYEEAYQSSLQSIILETQDQREKALASWTHTLDVISRNMSKLKGSAPKAAAEQSLMTSILDIERQCHDRISFLESRRFPSTHPYLSPYPANGGRSPHTRVQGRAQSTDEGLGHKTWPQHTSDSDIIISLNPTSSLPDARRSMASPGSSPTTSNSSLRPKNISKLFPSSVRSKSTSELPPHTMIKTLRTAKPGKLANGTRVPSSATQAASLAWGAESKGRDNFSLRARQSNKSPRSSVTVTKPAGTKTPPPPASHCRSIIEDEPLIDLSTEVLKPIKSQPITVTRKPITKTPPPLLPTTTTTTNTTIKQSPPKQAFDPRSHVPKQMSASSTNTKKQSSPVRVKQQPNVVTPVGTRTSVPTQKVRTPEIKPPSPNPSVGLQKVNTPQAKPPSPNPGSGGAIQNIKTPEIKTLEIKPPSPNPAAQQMPSTVATLPPSPKPKQKPIPGPKPDLKLSPKPKLISCCETLTPADAEWEEKAREVVKGIRGIDETAANAILNDIVLKGDEVHWDDIAGLDAAKASLKETVVYPFLRPDLFKGLREPARGMLLFGPPGTGKTMLARAVATESNSTFFSISASSLTSKYLGESEKLVRALFQMSKALAPSIIFVDEIDSLLSTRSESGENEASRRIKTEFLVQWSDLQHAAAGKDQGDDMQRVLVLAATNIPWAIDEAARRRFVRRQYIPLPERETRQAHLSRLMSHQKHAMTVGQFETLLELTDGFSGSDVTALAKDAAMGPLRSLGEALLTTPRENVRPMGFEDFVASLKTIRPSVSKEGLKAYEDWAALYGSSGA